MSMYNDFQVSLNSSIIIENNDNISGKIIEDKEQFDLSGNTILSLKNIFIPEDVNPLNYILMIQYLNVSATIDKKYQISQPVNYYSDMTVPHNDYQTIIEDTNNILFNVNLYRVLINTIKNKEIISSLITENLNINPSSIIQNNPISYTVDPSALLVNGQLNEKVKKYCETEISKLIDFDSYKSMINFEINYIVEDDVSKPINNSNELTYIFNSCKFKVIQDKQNSQIWTSDEWKSNIDSSENILSINLSCLKDFKIFKHQFYNLTKINLDENPSGQLNQQIFKKFNIPIKQINPYNRFRYFFRTDKF